MKGFELILMERHRQRAKGYTTENDAQVYAGSNSNQLSIAAEAYEYLDRTKWPWLDQYWKPENEITALVKSGALYLAHYEMSGEPGTLVCIGRVIKKINKAQKERI